MGNSCVEVTEAKCCNVIARGKGRWIYIL